MAATGVAVKEVREVSLFGTKYHVLNGVRPYVANQIVPQLTIGDGDPSKEDEVSKWHFAGNGNTKGGLGKYQLRPGSGQQVDQFFDASVRTDTTEMTLLPLATQLTNFAAAVVDIKEWSGFVYVAAGSKVRRVNQAGVVQGYCTTHTAWETDGAVHAEKSMTGTATSLSVFNGKLVVWQTTLYTTYDGATTWTDVATAGVFGTPYDGNMVKIDANGQLKKSTDLATWNDIQTGVTSRVYDCAPTGLAIYEDGNGTQQVFVGTTGGPWVLVSESGKVLPLQVQFSDRQADNCRGIGAWNGDLVFGKGGSLRVYTANGRQATHSEIGPNKDDGLVSGKVGRVVATERTMEHMLVAAVDAGAGTSGLYVWRGASWHPLVVGSAANKSIRAVGFSTATATPGIFYGEGTALWSIPWYDTTANPRQTPLQGPYRASGDFTTFWFGAPEFRSSALDVRFLAQGLSDTETIFLDAGYDNDDTTWNPIGQVAHNGASILQFPNGGQPFRTIRLRLRFARGSTTNITPRLIAATLRWEPLPRPVWGFGFEVDVSGDYNGKTPAQMEKSLRAAAKTVIGVFSYRTNDDRNVRVQQLRAMGPTGPDKRAHWQVVVIERVSQDEAADYLVWDGSGRWDAQSAWA